MKYTLHTAVAGTGKLLSWSRFLLICLFSPLPSVLLLIQSPPLCIPPDSVPSPRYRSCFSPLPSVSLLIQSPPLGIAPDSVPMEEGWAPAGRRAGATEGGGRRAGATVSLLIQSPPLCIAPAIYVLL